MVWDVLFVLALSYLFFTIFETGRMVRSTNDYVKSLDNSLTRWMAEPRDSSEMHGT